MKQTFSADNAGIGRATEHIRHILEGRGIKGREIERTTLTAEEAMGELVAHAATGGELCVVSRTILGTTTFELSTRGEAFDLRESLVPSIPDLWAIPESKIGDELRRTILRSRESDIKYKHKDGINTVRLAVTRASRALFLTLGALIAAILIGVLLAATAPAAFIAALDGNLLTPVKTMYMNALKMIAAPVVFFSIVGCFSQQSNPSGLGRIGGKIIGLYMLTTVIAVWVGIGAFHLFRPGDPAAAAGLSPDVSAIASQAASVSVRDMIVGIVPTNILAPFLESNMLQLIFLAVLCGVAVGLIGDYSKTLRDLFEACGELFLKITSLVMRATPVAVFCAILSMVLKTGPASLVSVASMFGTFLFGLLIMALIYCGILAVAGLNPLRFLRLYLPSMVQVFSIASSNAAISINMEACKKDLRISPTIYSLSIPLGATINMDGTSILLAVQALTLAKIYGVAVPGSALVTLAISIILMSIGAPGVPGSGVIILSMLLSQIGVPVEGVALVMGIGPLVGMFISMCNCLGDVVITTVVAKNEKLMDLKAWRRG
ncbi:MAG: dicarboxylate/amino acid:cation symporter [Clostridia bacterium]|nr:dicarboxylate/amino acid:cation symporter [Clostridia bacterium]